MNVICTLYDDNFAGFIPLVLKTLDRFSGMYGFRTEYYTTLFNPELHPAWNKVYAILDCFSKGYEWVMWADADSLFVGTSPENVCYAPFITTTDSFGICTSHMVVKNTPYNIQLLKTLLFLGDVKDDGPLGKKWEQNTMKALREHFQIPLAVFRQGFVKEPKWHSDLSGAQFLHFGAMPNDERCALMGKHSRL